MTGEVTLEMGFDYYVGWSIYLLAVVALQYLVWRFVSRFKQREVRVILFLTAFAVVITPTQLLEGQSYWVPAFIAALMDFLDGAFDSAVARLTSILLVLFGLLVASITFRLAGPKLAAVLKLKKPEAVEDLNH